MRRSSRYAHLVTAAPHEAPQSLRLVGLIGCVVTACRAFPGSAERVPDSAYDEGRIRPAFVTGAEAVERLLARNPAFFVLVRDEGSVAHLVQGHACLAVADAKGLEFNSVVILNFFGSSPCQVP